MNNQAKNWIERLQLSAHPEGGYFKETYRSTETICRECLPERFPASRVFSTAIYFLLAENDFSALHRIKQDEIWHFHDGSALTIHIFDTAGRYHTRILGKETDKGAEPQIIVKAGDIFGAELIDKTSFTLAGCTVAPGFDYADFELLPRSELQCQFPGYREIIRRLTRS